MCENVDKKNSEFGKFSHSAPYIYIKSQTITTAAAH